MAQRWEGGEREREEAGSVDQRSEDDGAPGDAQRVPEGVGERRPVALVQMVEEVDLIGLGGTEDGGGDQDGGDVQRGAEDPHAQEGDEDRQERGDHRQQPGGGAAEDEQEDDEDERGGDGEALRQRRHEVPADLHLDERLAHHAHAGVPERRRA